jgi:hypothetical protein
MPTNPLLLSAPTSVTTTDPRLPNKARRRPRAGIRTCPSQQRQDATDQAILYLDGTKHYAIEYSALASSQEIIYSHSKTLEIPSNASFGNCTTNAADRGGIYIQALQGISRLELYKMEDGHDVFTDRGVNSFDPPNSGSFSGGNRLFETIGF